LDGHELFKILNGSTGPGAYGFAFTVTAMLPDASSVTSQPLADVFVTPGFDSDSAVAAVYSAIMRGDFNLDGRKDGADIGPMLQAFSNLENYQSANQLSNAELLAIGDVNLDGALTNADIQAFLGLLVSGNASASAVPEPSTFAIISSAIFCFAFGWLCMRGSAA
jgi:hypothetical protein